MGEVKGGRRQLGFGLGVEQETVTSDDYYTPAWLFEAMAVTFTIDVAAPPGGVDYIPCERFYTQADDGLSQPWEGLVWMNPPFSGSGAWVQRFMDHGNGVALLPGSNGSWFAELWAREDAFWKMLPSSLAFNTHEGPKQISRRTYLIGMGFEGREAVGRVPGTMRGVLR